MAYGSMDWVPDRDLRHTAFQADVMQLCNFKFLSGNLEIHEYGTFTPCMGGTLASQAVAKQSSKLPAGKRLVAPIPYELPPVDLTLFQQ